MRFEKWQALGNDYMIVEEQELPFELTPERVRRLCRGHFGVAADGVLLLSRPRHASHVAELRIFNPDGSEAELSGNGARQALGFQELLAGDVDTMKRRTRNYARRQLTWMRKLAGVGLIDVTDRAAADVAEEILEPSGH